MAELSRLLAPLSLSLLPAAAWAAEPRAPAPVATATSPGDGAAPGAMAERIVTLGGAVTETALALGLGPQVIGVDDSSVGLPGVARLPRVGYHRTVGAEGILSLSPTMVIATPEAGPPVALDQVRGAGTRLIVVPAEHTVEGARQRIRAIAAAFGRAEAGEALVARIDRELAQVATEAPRKPKVLFLFSPGSNVLSASGNGTAAAEMIRLAGGTNAISGYDGYKPLSAEAAVAAAPDVILVTDATSTRLGGVEGLLALPGLAATPAGRAKRIVSLDDLFLLGFGPRTGEAVRALAEEIRRRP